MDIRRLGPLDLDRVIAASSLFDEPARREWAEKFLGSDTHHLLIAEIDGVAAGMITGVETTHPDKGTEMFLYELSVAEAYRRQSIGTALVTALRELAKERGCHGMWVGVEQDNVAALATYRAAGAAPPEPFVLLAWTFGDSA